MRNILLGFFSHRTLALLRWDIYFLGVRCKNALLLRKSALQKRLAIKTSKKYLNLGSGPRGLSADEWINIDGFRDTNVHYLCDFNRRLPFDDAVFDGIFCEHVLEHFDFQNGAKLMQECLRILKAGGAIRIIVPNGLKFMKAYFEDPQLIVEYKQAKSGHAIEAVNSWFYQRYEHQCIYDGPYLISMLKSVGFSEAVETAYNEAVLANSDLLIDDAKYCWESLYVEARK